MLAATTALALVAVASFDLAAGEGQRFIAGLLTPQRVGIVGGEVEMVFTPPRGTPDDVVSTTATFLPVPGLEPETDVDGATVLQGRTSIWYRLWVDDDDRVRQAEMKAQGHFMGHRYRDFDEPVVIQPPSTPG